MSRNCLCSQVTLSVAKQPFGDDFVYNSSSHASCGEVPWQLQQLHLYTDNDTTHLHPQPVPVSPRMTDWNTRPLPSPPCTHRIHFVVIFSLRPSQTLFPSQELVSFFGALIRVLTDPGRSWNLKFKFSSPG